MLNWIYFEAPVSALVGEGDVFRPDSTEASLLELGRRLLLHLVLEMERVNLVFSPPQKGKGKNFGYISSESGSASVALSVEWIAVHESEFRISCSDEGRFEAVVSISAAVACRRHHLAGNSWVAATPAVDLLLKVISQVDAVVKSVFNSKMNLWMTEADAMRLQSARKEISQAALEQLLGSTHP